MDYASIRKLTDASATVNRVEVNQRALIDKILARYATASAVYRELLQNSNDANATVSEIEFTTKDGIVESVMYRNNGFPFREQDWDRLRKIAEGNPDASKIGAFGVGAYSMFSITEEPVVVSGSSCLLFCWKGDALYTKTAKNEKPDEWTTFILPSRDPYPTPDFKEFGEFLASSLTFTKALKCVRVTLNGVEKLSIVKTLLVPPRPVQAPPASKGVTSFLWDSLGSSSFQSNSGMFTLARDNIEESVVRLTVQIDQTNAAYMDARYVIAKAPTRITAQQQHRMHRVTKKDPPKEVTVQLFLNYNHTAAQHLSGNSKLPIRIAQSFAPAIGKGKIFIGFRTSQTTGLAAHVAAPFLPTVEREAMDLQDPALAKFNKELLEIAGMLLRLTLEHSMRVIDAAWRAGAKEREELEAKLLKDAKPVQETEVAIIQNEEEEEESPTIMGFARFMARGVKKKIVAAAKTILEGDGTEHLLHPLDPRPLSPEEEQAVILMSSFCPNQSTPDQVVGEVIANAFERCLQKVSPPVLTKSGVLPGNKARLPHFGIEGFVSGNVVRSIMFQNAEEYHTVVAGCKKLNIEDLLAVVKDTTYNQETVVRLLRWWRRFCHVEGDARYWASRLKEAITFRLNDSSPEEFREMKNYLFYVGDRDLSLLSKLPWPETVLPSSLQEEIGRNVLTTDVMGDWFTPLPFEIFAEFISHDSAITDAKPEDEHRRVQILVSLCQEYNRKVGHERTVFGGFCHSLLQDKRCIPFDSVVPTPHAAGFPSDLYLYTAELKAFEGIGSFHKVSTSLEAAGITEEFLLILGVRKSVSIDFLFSNLETLTWSKDPKSLVEYLRSATLTPKDINKLSATQYLPAAGDDHTKTFAPSELYLPNDSLKIFPFVKRLQWPSEPVVSEKSQNGRFLKKLGMRTMPSLVSVLSFVCGTTISDEDRVRCLDFLSEHLNPHSGTYYKDFSSMGHSSRKNHRFLPCEIHDPMKQESVRRLCSPVDCFPDASCAVMGFPVLNEKLLGKQRVKLYGNLFQLPSEPQANTLLNQFSSVVVAAKRKLQQTPEEETSEVAQHIEKTFAGLFEYLSKRATSLSQSSAAESLATQSFIPILIEGKVEWLRPDEVFFKRRDGERDELTEELFRVISYSPFLSVCGVKETATTREIFQRVLQSPESVLRLLGSESKYRSLLRRIAAEPPFSPSRIPSELRNCRFLLGYSVAPPSVSEGESGASDGGEKATYQLASAEEIFIIDNSNYARMFPVLRAPPETDLEDFYAMLGSKYISKSVGRRFEVFGSPAVNTSLTNSFKERLKERGPLLVSPIVTSRPLAFGAASIISDKKLEFYEATNLLVVYTLGKESRRTRTTCFSRPEGRSKNAFFMTSDFDFFDAGQAVGDLILKRCQLEDAFLISSLLEAPLEQLRSRGFPVDRILKPEPPPVVKPTPSINDGESTSKAEPDIATTSAQEVSDTEAKGAKASAEKNLDDSDNSKAGILKQMFPDAEEKFLQAALGDNPSMDQVRRLAEQMSGGSYPTKECKDDSTVATEPDKPDDSVMNDSSSLAKKKSLRKRLGKAFNGIKGSSFGGSQLPTSNNGGVSEAAPPTSTHSERREPVSPAVDANTQSSLERMLEQSVATTTKVEKSGFESPQTNLTSIPKQLDKGDSCESIPGQSLKPFIGPFGTGKTHNGIVLFSHKEFPDAEDFMKENEESIKAFAVVLESLLLAVFDLKIGSCAIYHDPAGSTIAFNRNRALHFNLRFFHALHFLPNKHGNRECYSYWFMVICHELAHNLVTGHTKEHGFYTESFAIHYLPKLSPILRSLQA